MHADRARLGEPFDATDECEGASRCTFHGSDLERSCIQRPDGAAEADRGDHVSARRVKADVVGLVLSVLVDKLRRIVGELKHAPYHQATLSRRAVQTLVMAACPYPARAMIAGSIDINETNLRILPQPSSTRTSPVVIRSKSCAGLYRRMMKITCSTQPHPRPTDANYGPKNNSFAENVDSCPSSSDQCTRAIF